MGTYLGYKYALEIWYMWMRSRCLPRYYDIYFLLQRTSAHLGPHSSLSRAHSTHSTASSHSDLSLDSNYSHLAVHAMDDDFVRGKDSTQITRKTSRDSLLRRFLSANDISIKTSEHTHTMHIENPAEDIPSLQQQLALRYVPEIPPDNIR